VVVTGCDETGRPGSLLVLKRSVAAVECKCDLTRTADVVLIEKRCNVGFGLLGPYGPYFTHNMFPKSVCDLKQRAPIAYTLVEKNVCYSLNRMQNQKKNGAWYK
jgi:hypothetical protein